VNSERRLNITSSAYDAATGRKLENAIVKLRITFGSNGTTKEIMDGNGKVIYSAEVTPNPKNNSNNNYTASVKASAPAYISTTKTTTHSSAHFQLVTVIYQVLSYLSRRLETH
jgi:hypothetical protein